MRRPRKYWLGSKLYWQQYFSHFYTIIVKLDMVIPDTLWYKIESKATKILYKLRAISKATIYSSLKMWVSPYHREIKEKPNHGN